MLCSIGNGWLRCAGRQAEVWVLDKFIRDLDLRVFNLQSKVRKAYVRRWSAALAYSLARSLTVSMLDQRPDIGTGGIPSAHEVVRQGTLFFFLVFSVGVIRVCLFLIQRRLLISFSGDVVGQLSFDRYLRPARTSGCRSN